MVNRLGFNNLGYAIGECVVYLVDFKHILVKAGQRFLFKKVKIYI